jgi:hypothetical protein
MTQFGEDAKSLIGLSGIFIGLGEILGELVIFYLQCCFGSHDTRDVWKADKVVDRKGLMIRGSQ